MNDWSEIKRLREENERRQHGQHQNLPQAQVLQRERDATEQLFVHLDPRQYLDELHIELSPELPDIHISEWVWRGSSLFCQIKLGQNTREVHVRGSGIGEPWGVVDFGSHETVTIEVGVVIVINPDGLQIGSTIITDPDKRAFKRTLIQEVASALQRGFPETYGPPSQYTDQSPPSLITRFLRWLSS